MKTILKLLLAAFVLSLTPTMHVCAQGHIETPAERQARLKREAAAKKKREQVQTERWAYVDEYNEGLARVTDKSGKGGNGKWGYIDTSGKLVIPLTWLSVSSFHEGLAGVMNDERKWGFIDKTGNLTQIKVLKSAEPDLDEEAVRVVSQSPKWTPASLTDGTPVNAQFTFPINFRLNR